MAADPTAPGATFEWYYVKPVGPISHPFRVVVRCRRSRPSPLSVVRSRVCATVDQALSPSWRALRKAAPYTLNLM